MKQGRQQDLCRKCGTCIFHPSFALHHPRNNYRRKTRESLTAAANAWVSAGNVNTLASAYAAEEIRRRRFPCFAIPVWQCDITGRELWQELYGLDNSICNLKSFHGTVIFKVTFRAGVHLNVITCLFRSLGNEVRKTSTWSPVACVARASWLAGRHKSATENQLRLDSGVNHFVTKTPQIYNSTS